jgi:hypothetical protein
MKAIPILTVVLLTLQVSVLFAGNKIIEVPGTRECSAVTLSSLAPVTPAVATFEEPTMFTEVSALAPVAPAVATFEDTAASVFSTSDLAPVFPAEADFE